MSDCIVIAVLNGIEISHKLFTPEMVPDPRSIRGCESVLGMPLCRLIPVQLWTRFGLTLVIRTSAVSIKCNRVANAITIYMAVECTSVAYYTSSSSLEKKTRRLKPVFPVLTMTDVFMFSAKNFCDYCIVYV